MGLNQEYDTYWEQRGRHDGEQTTNVSRLTEPWHITAAGMLPDLAALRVLEVGCGPGKFALWMGEKAPRASITAIDLSQMAIAQARQKTTLATHAVNFAICDGEAMCLESEAFDLVISCECLEHVPHPEKMAREIHRVLTPGGRFILTTENYFNGMVLAWIRSWLAGVPYNSGSGVQPYEHFFIFWRVKRMLEKCDLVVDKMDSNHFQWMLLPRVAPAKLCTQDFESKFLKKLFRPFGRHFTFSGFRPE